MWYRELLVHGSIIVGFLVFTLGVASPLFDRFEPRQIGFSRPVTVSLPAESGGVYHGIGGLYRGGAVELMGFAFIAGQHATGSEVYLVLRSEDRQYVFDTNRFPMPDVTSRFSHLGLDLDHSGFTARLPMERIEDGAYAVGIYIEHGGIEALQYLDKAIVKSGTGVEVTERMSEVQRIELPPESHGLRLAMDISEEAVTEERRFLEVTGWAFIEGQSTDGSRIYLVLKSEAATYVFDTIQQRRPDVTAHFEETGLNLDNSGFVARIPVATTAQGTYQLGIYVEKADTEALQYTTHTVEL